MEAPTIVEATATATATNIIARRLPAICLAQELVPPSHQEDDHAGGRRQADGQLPRGKLRRLAEECVNELVA